MAAFGGDVDDAKAMLSSPSTWCQGAEALVKAADPGALRDLVRAYRAPHETSKICLLDAMSELGAAVHAAEIYATDPLDGLDLMRLFPADAHLTTLSASVELEDTKLRFNALRALGAQKQTPAWIAANAALLGSSRLDVRKQVVEALGRRTEPEARDALRARLAAEPDAALKARIELILGPE